MLSTWSSIRNPRDRLLARFWMGLVGQATQVLLASTESPLPRLQNLGFLYHPQSAKGPRVRRSSTARSPLDTTPHPHSMTWRSTFTTTTINFLHPIAAAVHRHRHRYTATLTQAQCRDISRLEDPHPLPRRNAGNHPLSP